MTSNDRAARRQAWDTYWATGRLHSCADGPDRNYDGAIGAFWRSRFAGGTGPLRVLDLATGNGPLPLFLHERLGAAVEVDAVDLSAVAPGWHDATRHAGIRFHSGVSMEALPFGDASFDHVVSQYGFEYADRDAALAECHRVTRPGASITFVMHHAQSVLVEVGREELLHHAWLESEEGLLRAAEHVVPFIARIRAGAAPTGEAVDARSRYNQAMTLLGARAQASSAPDLLLEARDRIHRSVAGVGIDPSPALQALRAYASDLAGARLRTAEMVGHALDASALEALGRRFVSHRPGVRIVARELRQPEGIVGWAWMAGPPDATG